PALRVHLHILTVLVPSSLPISFSSIPCHLHRHSYPRDLHSFPTRRSSDLNGRVVKRGQVLTVDGTTGRVILGTAKLVEPTVGGQDRKSTRLNSSHGSISYAVFCLKKKIK